MAGIHHQPLKIRLVYHTFKYSFPYAADPASGNSADVCFSNRYKLAASFLQKFSLFGCEEHREPHCYHNLRLYWTIMPASDSGT